MGIGPVPAIEGVCRRAGIRVEDVDLFEINEAFAAQYLGCEKLLEARPRRASTSTAARSRSATRSARRARASSTRVARELKARGAKYGIASACIGGGQGIAVLVRNPGA